MTFIRMTKRIQIVFRYTCTTDEKEYYNGYALPTKRNTTMDVQMPAGILNLGMIES